MLWGEATASPPTFCNDIIKYMSDKVAVFAENGLYDNSLGRLEKGYNIVTTEKAEAWIKLTNKVRTATPQEVASAYGV